MPTKLGLSKEQAELGLQKEQRTSFTPKEQIEKLQKEALDKPEARDEILGILKEYEVKYPGPAGKAIDTIAAIKLLELLKEE